MISVTMQTSFRWTSWKPAMGLPNWTRVFAYWSAQS